MMIGQVLEWHTGKSQKLVAVICREGSTPSLPTRKCSNSSGVSTTREFSFFNNSFLLKPHVTEIQSIPAFLDASMSRISYRCIPPHIWEDYTRG